MSLNNRIFNLEQKHLEIEEQIRKEYLSHNSEEVISSLKKQKLHIKEEIIALKKGMYN